MGFAVIDSGQIIFPVAVLRHAISLLIHLLQNVREQGSSRSSLARVMTSRQIAQVKPADADAILTSSMMCQQQVRKPTNVNNSVRGLNY